MPARNLLRHVFRHEPRDKVSEDALPLGMRQTTASNNHLKTPDDEHKLRITARAFTPLPKTPEPFGLEDIAEEAVVSTPSTFETVSRTESIASLDISIDSYSTRELVDATIDEAKTAASSHLETINTTLALLEALDGFSATISELKKDMLVKKGACEEKISMLEAVGRAVEGMIFLDETYGHQFGHDNEQKPPGDSGAAAF